MFTIITSGGNLHSFFRFTMCSPCFYIAILIVISNLPNIKTLYINLSLGLMFVFLSLFLLKVDYGGTRFDFSYLGVLLLSLTFLYTANRRFISVKYDLPLLTFILIFNTIWNTYMLNLFFSNGWIFTWQLNIVDNNICIAKRRDSGKFKGCSPNQLWNGLISFKAALDFK